MKTQIHSILIPTDFSDLSESALKAGIAIAKRQNAAITLLHIVDMFTYVEPSEMFLPGYGLMPDWILTMEDRLKELCDVIQHDTGIRVTGKILEGQPAERICTYAHKEKVSLIVMGTHGTSGLREFFIGSEAYRVVKNATCPVLTVPGKWEPTKFERVLFPVRLQTSVLDKYFFARPMIEKNNSELFLLGLSSNKNQSDFEKLSAMVDAMKIQLHNDNVTFRTELIPCDDFPAKVIEIATEYDSDLIILTANLDNSFKAYFVGPYAQQVINHSKLPVLSIKPSNRQAERNQPLERAGQWGKTINFSGLQ
jgi:nucleotide-binding universal stress UspA family protein